VFGRRTEDGGGRTGESHKEIEDMKGNSERIQANYSALKKMFTKVDSNTQKLAIDKIFQEIQEIKELCKKKSESSSDSDSDSVSSPKPSPSDGEDEEEHPVPKSSKKSNLF
jgi:archaellum component FlaC